MSQFMTAGFVKIWFLNTLGFAWILNILSCFLPNSQHTGLFYLSSSFPLLFIEERKYMVAYERSHESILQTMNTSSQVASVTPLPRDCVCRGSSNLHEPNATWHGGIQEADKSPPLPTPISAQRGFLNQLSPSVKEQHGQFPVFCLFAAASWVFFCEGPLVPSYCLLGGIFHG